MEDPWCKVETEVQVCKKFPLQTIEDVRIGLTVPRNSEPLINRACKKEVLALILKALSQGDAHRHKIKNLVHRMVQRSPLTILRLLLMMTLNLKILTQRIQENMTTHARDDLYVARPVVLGKQISEYNHGQGRPQYTEEGGEYTRQELQNITVETTRQTEIGQL